MIPKANRLTLSSKHPFIGQKSYSPFFTLISHISPNTLIPQWAIQVSKRVDNRATVRNRLRRQISQKLYRDRATLRPQQTLIILRRKPTESDLPNLFSELFQSLGTRD
jgi:ribonuclease P protein component